jgi:serine phosphatase RsbU (regulator of sigma subunit)
MPHLRIVTEYGSEAALELDKEFVRAGRSPSNDIRLDDPAASREHFELRLDKGSYFIRDLDSRNGTAVNGVPLGNELMLLPGDEITVGRTRLVYHEGDSAAVKTAPGDTDSGTMMFAAEELSLAYLAEAETKPDKESRRSMFLLNEMAREFMSVSEESVLLELLAARMLGVFSGDRCAVVYDSEDGEGDIDVKTVARARGDLSSEVRISTTAVRHVFDEKMALAITDVFGDDRFRAQQSILDARISSILCAPLWHGDTVFGLLYLDTTGRVGVFEKDQLALLSAFANLAAIKIDNLRLVAESIAMARMERELALAAEIQAEMLPRESFSFPGFECVGFNRACYEVGGDYFDFMTLGEDSFTVTVADVSGKGASGALLMASCKSMLTALVDTGVSLLERVTKLNRYVKDNSTANKFVTFFHAEIDGAAGQLHYCNAGHNPPILLTPSGDVRLLEPTGPVMGLLELPYTVGEAVLEPGAVLVAFSDGVTEALSPEDEEYGDDRLVETVSRIGSQAPEIMRDEILADVSRFVGGGSQTDDVTLVIVRRSG